MFLRVISIIDLPALLFAEPAEFQFMLRGYIYAGNEQDDPKALGGYARSDNLPKKLTKDAPAEQESLYLQLSPASPGAIHD